MQNYQLSCVNINGFYNKFSYISLGENFKKDIIWFDFQYSYFIFLTLECDECSNGSVCNQQTGICNEGYTTNIDSSTKGSFVLMLLVFLLIKECFFVWVIRPTLDSFTHMERTLLLRKDCESWPILDNHGHWATEVL